MLAGEAAFDARHQLVRIEWLGDDLPGAEAAGDLEKIMLPGASAGGNGEDGRRRPQATDLANRLQPFGDRA